MNMVGNLMERLRPIVNSKTWEYCVLWKLSEDQRYLEWMDCCCGGGSESIENGGDDEEEIIMCPVSSCRDIMFMHPARTTTCLLLANLPSSIPMDSAGIHAHTIISGQAMWLNCSNDTADLNTLEEFTVGTRVLIPLPIGLVELFVSKQVHEDGQIIDFVTCQWNMLLEQHTMVNPSATNEIQQNPFLDDENDQNGLQNPFPFQPPIPPIGNKRSRNELFGEPNHDCLANRQLQRNERDLIKQENGNSESISDCSDFHEDDQDEGKYRRKGKGTQCKNLEAERKRRKKLNDKLYALRALVPRISKMDKASILGDAMVYVKELEKQAKELQQELESHSEDEEGEKNNDRMGINLSPNRIHLGSKQEHESVLMEPQVEVVQLGGNEFFVKVFCEHKPGGLVKLMEALNSLGLEVIHVNIASFRSLVSNVFKLEMKDGNMIQADNVRDSLLEITRDHGHQISSNHLRN